MTDKIAILKKYNFWDGQMPDLGYIREKYLENISRYLGNRLIKVLVGQRRVGKSYILRQIIKKLVDEGVNPINVFYLNKEYTPFDFVTHFTDLELLVDEYRDKMKPQGKIYLILDEIQNIEGWERLINSYSQSYIDDFELFISGSNSHFLSGELASLLSGRYIQFEVFPFSFQEFVNLKSLENSRGSYLKYMQSGGLPDLFRLPDEETKRHYLSAVKDTVLLRDIIQRYSIKDARLLEDLFAFLVNNASNMISIKSIVDYFLGKQRKTNYETISNYIEHIRSTFLIHQAVRYHIKGKEILSGNCKYYMNDLSFKNFLYPALEHGYGYMLENLVYLHLACSGYKVYVGHMRGKEIDFVAMKNDRVVYLQVSYLLTDQSTIEREYSPLESVPDNYEKFVVTLDDLALPNRRGIKHVLAWQLDEVL